MIRPTAIVLHHSLTEDGQTVNWQAIRDYHTLTKRWDDIGYHFGVEWVVDRYEILGGRLLNQPGAHCKELGMNWKSIGICMIGNFDKHEPTPGQLNLLRELVKSLMFILYIPVQEIYGHREFAPYKTCPGRKFDLDAFRRTLV